MNLTLKDQAWQSGLVLSDDRAEWNENDWPPLEGGWRHDHASVVLDHPDQDNNNNGQTVVVFGGKQQHKGFVNSVLLLNLAEYNKQWREGPPMNQKRYRHAAVVCNGGIYAMGGRNNYYSLLDCVERIDANDVVQSSLTNSTTHGSHWTTLTCCLSTVREGVCAVAVHNRYIVVMGGHNGRFLPSVDIVDTRNHTVIAGPNMTVPRLWCASAFIGHRIFVVGGFNEGGDLDSVEIFDFAKPCNNEERNGTLSTFISSLSGWTTHSDLVLSDPRHSCAVVTVGFCLVVAENNGTVEILDTHHNRMWNLPPFRHHRNVCTMVSVANQIAVIGGSGNPTYATVPLMDKNTWCFRQLCKQNPNEWFHSLEDMGIREINVTSCSTSVSTGKRVRTNSRIPLS